MSAKGIRVTVLDHESGDIQIAEVPAGEYLLLTTTPCWLAHTQMHSNGTHVLTVKGRLLKTREPARSDEREK